MPETWHGKLHMFLTPFDLRGLQVLRGFYRRVRGGLGQPGELFPERWPIQTRWLHRQRGMLSFSR